MRYTARGMERIEDFARAYYPKLDFAHSIGHGERVVKIARKIMETEGGEAFLLGAAAWLHQLHDDAEASGEFLSSLEIDDEIREKVRQIVAHCEPDKIHQGVALQRDSEKQDMA